MSAHKVIVDTFLRNWQHRRALSASTLTGSRRV
jgi:hypothetical protein